MAREKKAAEERTGVALFAYLQATGSTKLPGVAEWLKANDEATAKELYAWMDATPGFKDGTIRKAGKFAFGDEFEPDRLVQQFPSDEITRLRGENANLQRRIDQLSSENIALVGRLNVLQALNEERRIGGGHHVVTPLFSEAPTAPVRELQPV